MSTKVRAHSKFSASGAERWTICSGSVQLSEGLPDKDSVWSIEGTRAHDVLERLLRAAIEKGVTAISHSPRAPAILDVSRVLQGIDTPNEMRTHALNTANFILRLWSRHEGADIRVETRIYLEFIHPEMFGTFDGAVIDHFGTLHVFDFKYGAGHAVSPTKNLQMIFYGLGLAHLYDWNFKRVRLWIDQPRIKGYDGPAFWEISILELKEYVGVFERAVERVLKRPYEYVEGSHCHWCKAKSICPLKTKAREQKAIAVFTAHPLQPSVSRQNGKNRN